MIRLARRTRALALATFTVATLAPALHAQATPTAEQVIEKYVAAIGGREAWQKKQSMRVVAELQLGAQGTATQEILLDRAGRMFGRTSVPTATFEFGFDGETAWSINPMQGAAIVTGKQAESMRVVANLPLMAYEKGSYRSATLVGAADFDGRKAWQLTLVPLVGPEMTEYFDQATGLKIGSAVRLASEMGELDMRFAYRDYTKYGDVTYPKTTVQFNPMSGEMVGTAQTLEFDTVPATAFALPNSVKALKKP